MNSSSVSIDKERGPRFHNHREIKDATNIYSSGELKPVRKKEKTCTLAGVQLTARENTRQENEKFKILPPLVKDHSLCTIYQLEYLFVKYYVLKI